MALKNLFRSSPVKMTAYRLYGRIVEQSRLPGFYAQAGVPDTVDGRFDMIALHLFLVLRRLKDDSAAAALAQELSDAMFADMDRNLREIGVSDVGLGRKVQKMAEGVFGRIAAYDKALADADDDALNDALRRNLYGTVAKPAPAHAAAMAAYVRAEADRLAGQKIEILLAGDVHFGPPPEGG